MLLSGCTGSPPGPPGPAVPASPSTTAGAAPTTAGAAPTTAGAAPTTVAPPSSIRLRFTGDMLVSDALREQAARYAGGAGFDFGPMLAGVAPLLADADLTLCHQETPVSDDDVHLSGYPLFNAPLELAEAEAAVGYDGCSTASNHTVDLGQAGIDATLGTLDRVGLGHTGSARSAAEAATARIYDVGGVRVGHLAYAFGLNGRSAPSPWSVNLIDPAVVRSDAAALRAAGADFVVASLHFGTEQDPVPSAYQQQVVAAVMAGPEVDLVIGHHAHVVQPAEQLPDGRWVFFGLGNFLAQQELTTTDRTPPHRDGVIVEVTVTRGARGYRVSRAGYVPTFVDAPSDVVELAPPFSAARTTATLTSAGAPLVDLTPP